MITFSKLEGLGNDFILIDEMEERSSFKQDQVRPLCVRHFGIGADGIILLHSDPVSDAKMIIYNADGSRPEMCGNAIRCVGVYLHKKTKKNTFTIQTDSGIKEVKTHKNSCTVTMGKPIFELEKIPCLYPQNPVPLSINNDELSLFVVSMGNPHAVIEVKNLEDPITTWGALIETQAIFPQKTNVEFVKFIDKNRIAIKVWERGVGYTQACGTGACASAVAMICLKKCTSPVTVDFTEGSLLISWNDNENVLMEGPANLVFTGQC